MPDFIFAAVVISVCIRNFMLIGRPNQKKIQHIVKR